MATIKVNLSYVGNACDQDATPAGHFPGPGWYVFLADCHGKPIVRAGKEYGPFPVNHGYVEIPDVPPGRYILFAIVDPFPVSKPIPGGEVIFQSNFASHFAIIDVCCGCNDYCVTLYNSGWHYCVTVIVYWFQLLMEREQLAPEVGRNAIDALNKALSSSKAQPTDIHVVRQLAGIVERFQAKPDRK
jgi:hypothetical protein